MTQVEEDQYYQNLYEALEEWRRLRSSAEDHPEYPSILASKRSMAKRVRKLAVDLLSAHSAEELRDAME